jgi:hypothetical protein
MIFGGNTESNIRIFVDNCIIYRKVINDRDIENLWIDLEKFGVRGRAGCRKREENISR